MFAVLLVLAFAYAAGRLLNKRIYETLPVATFVTALSVYVFALMLPLNVSFWISVGIAVTALVASYLLVRRDSLPGEAPKGTAISGNLVPYTVLLIVCVIFGILLSGHKVFFYDDLSYWGIYTKNIFRINKLPQLFENCSVDYKDYMPIMQILQYIAMFGRKSFDEGMMFQTNVCFIYIVLLPVLSVVFARCERKESEEKDTGSKSIKRFAVILYVIFPHILTAQFYYRLGVDLLLALVFGYILYYVFIYETSDKQSEWFRMVTIATGLSFLALIKSSGIVLCILAIITLIVREVAVNRKETKRSDNLVVIGKTAIAAAFAFGSYFSWQLFLRHSGNNGYLSNRVKDSMTGGSFSLPSYTGEVIINYIKQFFTYPLTRNMIGVTAFVLVLFIIFVHLLTARKDKDAMFVCSIAGLIVFCIAHICMYLFVFDEWEAHGLMEYDRYITQYLGGIFFLYACKLLKTASIETGYADNKGGNKSRILLIVSTVVFIALLPCKDMIEYLIPSNYKAAFSNGAAQMAQNAEDEWKRSGIAELELVHDGTQKLTVVADAWDETTQFLEYVAVPQPFNRVVNVPATEPGSINGYIMDFVDEYVYVCDNAPDSYTGDWSETATLTSDSTPLKAGTLYKVERTGKDKTLIEYIR